MKNLLLFTSISLASGLLLVNVYNSMIDTKSLGSDLPQSLETARMYFKTVNPGNFYRVFSPINQVLGLLVLILFWKMSPAIRTNLGIAFVFYVMADILTFTYFYPRNAILFNPSLQSDVDLL